MIFRFKYLSRRFPALAVWPFIILKYNESKQDEVLINHERIHLRQQIEMLWLPFFIWYILEFLIRWLRYRDAFRAYRENKFRTGSLPE